jgi:hypothetical protein
MTTALIVISGPHNSNSAAKAVATGTVGALTYQALEAIRTRYLKKSGMPVQSVWATAPPTPATGPGGG